MKQAQLHSAPLIGVPHAPTYLTKEEAARLLRVTTRTLESYMRQGWLPFVRVGSRTVRFRASDIDAALLTVNACN
jgi:excisionase family DNA binding protein